jgi:hypothetical protein
MKFYTGFRNEKTEYMKTEKYQLNNDNDVKREVVETLKMLYILYILQAVVSYYKSLQRVLRTC